MATFLKIAIIPCMLVLIFFLLMMIGFIPSKGIIQFLQKHPFVQAILGIMLICGVLGMVVAITT